MRLSVDFDPLGGDEELENARLQGLTPKVFVDGREIKYPVLVDDEIGFVVAYRTHQNGKFVFNRDRTEIKRRRLTGRVQIEMVRR